MKNSWIGKKEREAKKDLIKWLVYCLILYTFLYCFFFVWEI